MNVRAKSAALLLLAIALVCVAGCGETSCQRKHRQMKAEIEKTCEELGFEYWRWSPIAPMFGVPSDEWEAECCVICPGPKCSNYQGCPYVHYCPLDEAMSGECKPPSEMH